MEKESKKAQAVKFRNEVMEKVMEVNTFDVPEALVLDEIGTSETANGARHDDART